MDILLITVVSFLVAVLTFFSGFGLGTILLPAFAVFLPVELAVAATAVVHLANNLFKASLVGRHAAWSVLVPFILPAALCSLIGAWLLVHMSSMEPLHLYEVWGRTCEVTMVKLVIAALMIAFALFDLVPALGRLSFPPRLIPLGGALSGLFGGLSGHQGALRTAVLIRLGLSKEAFIGTSVLGAVTVDIFRLAVYGSAFFVTAVDSWSSSGMGRLLVAGMLAAFAGTFLGNRLLAKVTLDGLHKLIGWMILLMALALGAGAV